jgi:hypothetical protein
MLHIRWLTLHLFRDYQENRRQDQYENEHVDDQIYDSMDPEARRMAERAMYRRDVEEGRLPAAFDDYGT